MKLRLTLLAICFCLFNCKEETSKKVDFEYKYPSVENIIDCDNVDTDLLREAFYSFENDLVNFYTPGSPVYSRAYSMFVSQASNNKVDYHKMTSEHSKKVLEALKQQESLWRPAVDAFGSRVNYDHPFIACVGDNIKDEPLQKTFSALLQTNSMSLRMVGEELKRKTFGMKDDKYLATYIALEFFYGKIYDIDFSKAPQKVESNAQEHSSHDGHNH
ncbi:hypothetical protein [Psychroserpens luteolus]|uniref:hypothetical protein n=1 Tax=Psychroserpens luteolus TaxID=2855840 RepID=UPI001E4B9379|nr:hypothetical protein [Psychroserpens luteolus]MCD2258763.1 hypothetical protein [Psychroserpens luteolus]